MDYLFRSFELDSLVPGFCDRSDVIGISSLNALDNITRDDVLNSRGEFAGVFVENGEVVAFRDRLGARNIYYCIEGNRLHISTEIQEIARHFLHPKPDYDYMLKEYVQFQIPFSDSTFFADIKKVMPGEMVRFSSKGVEREKYWCPKFGSELFDAEHLRELVKDAVDFRIDLIGDLPYTSYLSGGIDSSSIALLTLTETCFSGFYEEQGYSELEFIESVVEKADFPMGFVPVQITEDSFQSKLTELSSIIPDPSCGLGAIPQVLVATEAKKQGFRYAFTGEGGDEIFSGYNWNYAVFSMADSIRKLLNDRYMVGYEPMVEKMLKDGFPTFVGGLLSRGGDLLFATQKILERWDMNECVENNVLSINLSVGLPAILTVDEQVGKFSDVEPVSPLVDHKIVEYVCSLKPSERLSIPKGIFRDSMNGILPEKVRTRYNKMGFPVPYKQWDWSFVKPALESLMKRGIIVFDIDDHHEMDRSTWALYNIEMWHQKFSDRK